jgi:hypothetical protein
MTIGSGAGLITQYEDLRGQAVSQSAGVRSLGYVLFIRQGMAAWACAWHSYTVEPPSSAPPPATHNPMPLELRSQVAVVLAGIIFNLQREEACSC